MHLWQFILELLGDHACKDIIAWTGNDLEFKVLNSRELARRWGKRKNKPRMNFDKLSRAMRYYYEKNIIKHIPGQRLVYRFCRNPDDIVFTQLLKTAMGTLPPEARLTAPVTTNPCFASPVDQTPTIPDGYFNSQNPQTMTVTNPFAVKQTVYWCWVWVRETAWYAWRLREVARKRVNDHARLPTELFYCAVFWQSTKF